MYKATVPIVRGDYSACNRHYLKKYFGVKEIIMLLFLLAAGLVLGIWAQQMFVLIMCGVAVVLVAGVVLFFFISSSLGYAAEFQKRGAVKWEIAFDEDGMTVELYEKGGEEKFTERHLYKELDKIAVLKDRVYLYRSTAVLYYVKYDQMTEGNFIGFCDFVKAKASPAQLKMKTKRKQFPYGR